VPHFGDELNRGNAVKSETLWLRSQIRYALHDDEKTGRFVEKVYKEGEIFPEFRIHAGFQLMQEDQRTGHQFVIPAPALNIRFTGVSEGWTLWSGQPIVQGSFITWYCGPSVRMQDLPLQHMPASTSALMSILKGEGLAHLTTHMATVKKGNLIVNCLPSTVCDANQTNREHTFMLTLWAAENIDSNQEIFHDYGNDYWRVMEEIEQSKSFQELLQSGGAPLGQWWRKEYDRQLTKKRNSKDHEKDDGREGDGGAGPSC